jgi:hypothetical protein
VVEVMNGATFNIQGATGSLYNASTGQNNNSVIMRPGSLVVLNNSNGVFTGSGGNGRWGATAGIELNGGTFRLTGAANFPSTQTIGPVSTYVGSGTLSVQRNASAGSAQLSVAGISRSDGGSTSSTTRGSLMITTSGNFSLGNPSYYLSVGNVTTTNASPTITLSSATGLYIGEAITNNGYIPTSTITNISGNTITLSANATGSTTTATLIGGVSPTSYDRLVLTNGLSSLPTGSQTLLGNTSNGANVTNGGIVSPWIIDAQDTTFVGYNPTGGSPDSGFQPLLLTTNPGAGQIGYKNVVTGGGTLTAGQLGAAGDTTAVILMPRPWQTTTIRTSARCIPRRTSVALPPPATPSPCRPAA